MNIIPCSAWGARPVSTTFPTKAPVGIVVHHTASPNVVPLSGEAERQRCCRLARSIQDHHMDGNGWADSGHHFLCCRSGLVLEGRHGSLVGARKARCVRGAHSGNVEINGTQFGIETEGTFDDRGDLSTAQWEALVNLVATLAWWGSFQTAAIHPHSLYRATQCPGYLKELLPELRRAAHTRKLALIEGCPETP